MLRAARLILGTIWAAALLVAGLWFWDQRAAAGAVIGLRADGAVSSAVFAVAAAGFVFMVLVADELCPRAPALFTGCLKAFAGALTWGALLWALVLAGRVLR